MPWIKDVCKDAIVGSALGFVHGVCGIELFSPKEVEEINNLKQLTLSVLEKSPQFKTEPIICEAIEAGKKAGLDKFAETIPATAPTTATIVATANLVCTKAFEDRFRTVLMGACLNLVGCA